MILTGSFECRIPCQQGDITVIGFDNGEWKLNFRELVKAIGVEEDRLLAIIKLITTSNPEKFSNPMLKVGYLKMRKKGGYSVKSMKLISLECAVALLMGEACIGNLLAGELIATSFYNSLHFTFETLAKMDKEENHDDNQNA